MTTDQAKGELPVAHGVDVRSNYLFNSTIYGIENADAILLVGTNPRHEAAVLNARIRKQFLRSDNLTIGQVGQEFESTFWMEHLGKDHASLKKALSGAFGKKLSEAKRPLIIVGSGVCEHPDSQAIFKTVGQYVLKNKETFINDEWNGYNILQRAASRAGAYDVGFVSPSTTVSETKAKVVYLLGADEIQPSDIPKDAFVIYQGHHGDIGAALADVILPGAAYTEKSATYVNTEGRAQMTRAAVSPPGAAREDWKILRAVGEYLNVSLPYEDLYEIRGRLAEIAPNLINLDTLEPASAQLAEVGFKAQLVDSNSKAKASDEPLLNPIENFYFTDSISRSSATMARSSAAFTVGSSSSSASQEPMTASL